MSPQRTSTTMELLPLVCLCLLSCSGDAVRVEVEEDSDAVLPCLISTEDLEGNKFDWKKDGQKEVFTYDAGIHHNNGRTGQDEQFKDRVSHFQDQLQNGNASIKITRTKVDDSGTYSCDFPRLQSQTFIIELVVDPRVKVVVKEGSDAVLNCSLSTKEDLEGKLFDWKKDGQREVFLYDAGIHYNNGRPGQDEQFKGRVSHFQDQLQNGDASIKITNTEMNDSGIYSCIFPRLQSQTFYIKLDVDRVLRDRTGENIPGAAPRPYIDIKMTKDRAMLQCEAHGVPPLTVEWKDSHGNILKNESTPKSEKRGRSSITLNITVTKTDNYRCVVTQKKISHQIFAETSVYIQGAAPEPVPPPVPAVRVLVEEGSDAVLPCLISTKEGLEGNRFDWKKDGQKEVFMYDANTYSGMGGPGQDEQFKGRVSHFQDQLQNGNASIKITRTKVADSGTYSCDFPRLQSQTFNIELVVDQVLKDRTGENIPGAASEPSVTTIATDEGVMLQCEVVGASPKPEVEWKDSSGNILPVKDLKETESGGLYDIVLQAALTKMDNFRCVVTQEKISHQIYAEIDAVTAVRVVVEEDSDAVLPCLISSKDLEDNTFDWRKDGQKEVFLYDAGNHYNNGLPGQDDQFIGRVSHFQDELQNGNASIKITNAKMADSGIYSCDFPRLQSQTFYIELVVDPRVRMTVEGGSDAVLNCSPDPKVNLTGQVFDWKKDGQKEKKEVFIHYSNGKTTQGPDFTGRVSHFKDQLQNGNASIKITNTKMADSGIYSCHFPDLQSQTFYMKLVVGASKPYVTTLMTDDVRVLQCEVVGASSKPKVEWKDSSGNVLPVKNLKETKRGDSYDIVLQAALTKMDKFRCFVTQKEINHQTDAELDLNINGEASEPVPPPVPGWPIGVIITVVVLILLLLVGCGWRYKKRRDMKKIVIQMINSSQIPEELHHLECEKKSDGEKTDPEAKPLNPPEKSEKKSDGEKTDPASQNPQIELLTTGEKENNGENPDPASQNPQIELLTTGEKKIDGEKTDPEEPLNPPEKNPGSTPNAANGQPDTEENTAV